MGRATARSRSRASPSRRSRKVLGVAMVLRKSTRSGAGFHGILPSPRGGSPMRSILFSVLLMLGGAVNAATYVYVSNADDGNISLYTLEKDGTLKPGQKCDAGETRVMPMSVSPDKKYLFAAVRSKPFTAVSYAIDRKSGALKEVGR